MPGVKGRSGRRKCIPALVSETLEQEKGYLPTYLKRLEAIALSIKALPKDRIEAISYLIDRALGTSKATTTLRVGRVETWDANAYAEHCRNIDYAKEYELKILQPSSNMCLEAHPSNVIIREEET